MSILKEWLKRNVTSNTAPLFAERDLVAETFMHNSMTKLKRSNEFDELMINTVEDGLQKESWEGFIYIMHWLRSGEIIPLYVGKAERRGVHKPLSFNIDNIRKNQHAFGRWGYGLAYHIGDLSHAMYCESAYKKPSKKYKRWAEALFINFDPPTLRAKVYVTIISWEKGMRGPSGLVGSVASVEKEIISLASALPDKSLVNIDGI
jgi:hypothetical protein